MKQQTLLEKAKLVKAGVRRTNASNEELDLMIAMIRGEITFAQASAALDKKHQNMAQEFYVIIRAGVMDGRVTIKRDEKPK